MSGCLDTFSQQFEAAVPQLRAQMLQEFGSSQSALGFRSVWESFEEVVIPIVVKFLTSAPLNISANNLKQATSKSTYPDLKVLYQGRLYAIDVKSGEDKREPWYDIGRLDTYEEKHLQKYAGEYSVVIKWAGRPVSTVLNVFIEPTYQTVGFKAACNGVYYRPYDGKLRPKGWADFEQGKTYWQDKDHFLRGLAASVAYRQRSLIAAWYLKMSQAQRQRIQQDLADIDAGKQVVLDNPEEGKDKAE